MSMIAYPADERFELNLFGLRIGGVKTSELRQDQLHRLMAARGIQGIHASMGKQALEMILAKHIRENGEC
jgi:hypothetical protein